MPGPETVAVNVTASPNVIVPADVERTVVVSDFVTTVAIPEAVNASAEGSRPKANEVPGSKDIFALNRAGTKHKTMIKANKLEKTNLHEGRLAMKSPAIVQG